MPSVIGAKALQVIRRKLPFCYLCGHVFTGNETRDRDHVPPTACIAQKDRAQTPLILPTHVACNASFKVDDERVGQFLSLLHGKIADPKNRRLKYRDVSADVPSRQRGPIMEAVTNVDMYGVVWRWLRAFHAALYMQPLPANAQRAIELPFEVVSPLEDGQLIVDSGRPRQRALCEETIASNRLTRTLDRLAAWNGQLRYECVWVPTQLYAYCVFWLDFYHWQRMALLTGKAPEECVGFYQVTLDQRPPSATFESQVITGRRTQHFAI